METFSGFFIFSVVVIGLALGLPLLIYKFTQGELADAYHWSEEEAKVRQRPQKKMLLNISLVITYFVLCVANGVLLQESAVYALIPYMVGSLGISAFISGMPMAMPYGGGAQLRVRDSVLRMFLFLAHLLFFGVGVFILIYKA